ncbi:acyltransferase domain-containing protein [Specibacter cremeus]|uniref:acyltransferase domain-containing protein n=1 Tax=Specibacter cremeus TaxID=1629051 RepID=UPI000F793D02|nr:acyltransferase domain-containing protein [Specibacter cremeus]
MTPHTAVDAHPVLDCLGVEAPDRADCLALLAGNAGPGVLAVLDHLQSRLGGADETVPHLPAEGVPATELDWIAGFLRATPALIDRHARLDIPMAVTRDTLADFGRNLAVNRRVHGRFGMDTYKWLTHHFAGHLFQLGRLQYLLHRPAHGIPGVGPDEWIVGVHIPEAGGLSAPVVDASLALAAPFFARHFPDRPVRVANCESWLLDPYLAAHLDPQSNIARFAARFHPYGTPVDEPTDAVYFTFRTRSMDHLAALPRTTALQRVVLDRIAAGGTWQLARGYLPLP